MSLKESWRWAHHTAPIRRTHIRDWKGVSCRCCWLMAVKVENEGMSTEGVDFYATNPTKASNLRLEMGQRMDSNVQILTTRKNTDIRGRRGNSSLQQRVSRHDWSAASIGTWIWPASPTLRERHIFSLRQSLPGCFPSRPVSRRCHKSSALKYDPIGWRVGPTRALSAAALLNGVGAWPHGEPEPKGKARERPNLHKPGTRRLK